MLVRFLNIQGIDTNYSENIFEKFEDAGEINKWAYDAMSYCSENEIMRGGKKWVFPDEISTTEQVIVMIHRLMKKYSWIESADYKYINSFKLPSDSEIVAKSNGEDGLFIGIYWSNLTNMAKFQDDFYYMLKNKFPKMTEEECDYVIDEIMRRRVDDSIWGIMYDYNLSVEYNYTLSLRSFTDQLLIYFIKD